MDFSFFPGNLKVPARSNKVNLIDRRIGQELLEKVVVTAIWLTVIYLFIALLDLLEDATVNIEFLAIIKILVLSIPKIFYQLAPMILFIGTILGMSTLAQQQELIVMQTSGISKIRITSSILVFSIFFAVAVFILGETVVPKSEELRLRIKHEQTSRSELTNEDTGAWIRDQNRFIHFERTSGKNQLHGVDIFHFDNNGNLHRHTSAKSAEADQDSDTLKLKEVVEIEIFDNRVPDYQISDGQEYGVASNFAAVKVQRGKPSQMTVRELYLSRQFLRANGLKTELLDIAYWNRFIIPVSMLVMAVFSILFSIRIRRRISTGISVFWGLFLGLIYYAVQQSAGYLAMFNGLSPLTGIFGTLIFFTICVAVYLRRV